MAVISPIFLAFSLQNLASRKHLGKIQRNVVSNIQGNRLAGYSPIWSLGCSETRTKKRQACQNTALRTITGCNLISPLHCAACMLRVKTTDAANFKHALTAIRSGAINSDSLPGKGVFVVKLPSIAHEELELSPESRVILEKLRYGYCSRLKSSHDSNLFHA